MSVEAGPSVEKKEKKSKRMVDGREETKEERRARKAAKREAKAAAQESAPDQLETADRASKRSDTVEYGEAAETSATDKVARKDKKDKKSKKLELAQASEDAEKLDGTAESMTTASQIEDTAEKVEKKDKKDKKRKREAANDDADPSATTKGSAADSGIAQPEEMSKKQKRRLARAEAEAAKPAPAKREMRAELEGDASLTEAAKKALEYAHQYVESQTGAGEKKWKFNKANQNWLIRNIWVETEIPDKHLETSLAYLKTVQGGARQNLIKVAEQHINPSPGLAAEQDAPADGEEVTGETSAQTAAPQSEEDKAEAERKAAILRNRGTRLLEAFK